MVIEPAKQEGFSLEKRYDSLSINDKLIWNLRDIGHTMRRIRDGKGSQKRILILLRESGVTTQSALTQRLGIQPGSASEVVRKLEKAGLLVRTVSAADRRTTDLWLTDRGRLQAEEAHTQREARHQQMFSCLMDQEKETLLSLLERVNASWDEHYRGGGSEDRPPQEGAQYVEVHP